MLKFMRKAKELVVQGGEDAETKRQIAEIRDACTTLLKTLGYWYKTFLDQAANTVAVHEDMANLYPASESLSVAVAKLNNSAAVFNDAPAAIEELKRSFEPAIAELMAKLAELAGKAHDRQVARAEIKHYQDKVAALANDAHAATDAKKQTKAESNNAKLQENNAIFRKLDEEITSALALLDADIGKLTNAAYTKFMQLQAKKAHALLDVYTQSLDCIGVEPDKAAAAPSAGGGGGGGGGEA